MAEEVGKLFRRLAISVLVLGVSATPAASRSASLVHDPTDSGTALTALPLMITQDCSRGCNLNLWLDPEGDPLFSVQMVVTSSGSLTVSFDCTADNCLPNQADPNSVTMVADNFNPGWNTPFKIGTFQLQPGGAIGDELTLDSGLFTNSAFEDVSFDPTLLAVVEDSNVCGDVNEDGMFGPNDVDALRLHLTDPDGGLLTAGGLARCAVIAPVECSILQAAVMSREVVDPALLPGRGSMCDCCIAHGSPACSDSVTQNCVCAVDALCCVLDWNATCVDRVDSAGCGSCSGP